MPKFKYTAVDSTGSEKNGIVEAVNRPAALLRLKEMGLTASSVGEISAKQVKSVSSPLLKPGKQQLGAGVPEKKSFFGGIFSKGLSSKQLMIFTRQLSTMNDAGVPLLRALQIIQKQEKSPVIKNLTGELCEAVEGGSTFYEALSQHPKIFNKLFVNMAKAGEVGGVLHLTLNRLAEFIEKAERIRTKVRGAMVYPILVLIMALGIMGLMLVKIVPEFTKVFQGLAAGEQLPRLTLFVVGVSNALIHRAPLIIGIIVALVIIFNVVVRTRTGRYWTDVLLLKMPVIGPLILKIGISRFTRTFGTLQSSGVPTLQALNIVRDTAGNEVIARAIQSVHDSIKEGESVSGPLELSGVFPTMVVSMVAVGEETGRLPEMLLKIADTYDTEVDAAVEAMTSIIEPVLIIFMAVIVGTIVIAMFMPLIGIIKSLSKSGT
jgi:type IV pilus assembly protein PilC